MQPAQPFTQSQSLQSEQPSMAHSITGHQASMQSTSSPFAPSAHVLTSSTPFLPEEGQQVSGNNSTASMSVTTNSASFEPSVSSQSNQLQGANPDSVPFFVPSTFV